MYCVQFLFPAATTAVVLAEPSQIFWAYLIIDVFFSLFSFLPLCMASGILPAHPGMETPLPAVVALS